MSVIVKQAKETAQKIADRLKPSGDPRAETHAVHGSGPTRTHTFVHHSGHVVFASTAANFDCGPQEQEHHDEASQQGVTSHFTGYKGDRDNE